jgi:diguanylate cyclase (GGDEF)-like protein
MGVTVWLVGLTVVAVRRRVKRLISLLADTARTDTLTQLRNRRAFDESLGVELERAARTGHPVALLLGDIDFFKTVNDRFGHPTGDQVLRDVASAISAAIRTTRTRRR